MGVPSISSMNALERRIEDKTAKIGVIGLGYVGLPLACLFAKKGFTVIGADIKKEVVEKINDKKTPINEPGLEEILEEIVVKKKLSASTDGGTVVREADIIFLVVQTPIDKDKQPDLNAFKTAWETVSRNLSPGKLLISESTVPPGTMKGVVVPILEKRGLKAGEDFYLAYSPERAIPTKTLQEIRENGRIVGGLTKKSAELAALIYSQIIKGDISREDIETAEMVKVIENAYRDVNIAFANEIALLCEKREIDGKRAIELANKHPRVNILNPGPGVGGHCIPKDPYFLLKSAEESGIELKLISSARKINESMPRHVLKVIKKSLREVNKDPEKSKVSILGIAYKGNTDDSRNSPAEPIVRGLMMDNINVISHDPFVSQDFGGNFSNSLEEVVTDSDCVVFIADHDYYREMDLHNFMGCLNKPCVVIDSRRLFDPASFKGGGVKYVGLGK
jgi:UDP-N-acetyl-D-mannosaminuronic acid dehydrogenase